MDNILGYGNSFKAALGSVRRVLQRIAAAGLKLHPDKCCFMRREQEFLGHKIGGEGISTLEEKIQSVKDWPIPINLRDLKRFLGVVSYYRRLVQGFSCIADPLLRLQKKDCDFVWMPECEQFLSSLKMALTNFPILTPPDPNRPFILDMDASDGGMGPVLRQAGEAGERAVFFLEALLCDLQGATCCC